MALAGSGRRQPVPHGNRELDTPTARSQPMRVPPPSSCPPPPHCGSNHGVFCAPASFVQEHTRRIARVLDPCLPLMSRRIHDDYYCCYCYCYCYDCYHVDPTTPPACLYYSDYTPPLPSSSPPSSSSPPPPPPCAAATTLLVPQRARALSFSRPRPGSWLRAARAEQWLLLLCCTLSAFSPLESARCAHSGEATHAATQGCSMGCHGGPMCPPACAQETCCFGRGQDAHRAPWPVRLVESWFP